MYPAKEAFGSEPALSASTKPLVRLARARLATSESDHSVDEIDEAEQTTAKRFGGFAAAAVAEFEYEPTEVGVDDLDVPEEEGSLVAKRYGGFAAAAVADLE